MASPDAAIERWFAVQRGHESRFLSCRNIISDARTLYSYGRHFPLIRRVDDASGQRDFWLVNGDRFSNTTNRHQSSVRSYVRGDRSVTIPQTVLEAASIDIDSIKLLDVTSDRMVTTVHSSITPPPRMQVERGTDWVAVPLTEEEILADAERRYCEAVVAAQEAFARYVDEPESWAHKHYMQSLNDLLTVTPMERFGPPELHDWHWRNKYYRRIALRHYDTLKVGWREVHHIDTENGPRYVWETQRHWLGESLIEARIPHYRRTVVCTTCDGTGWAFVSTENDYWNNGHCGHCTGGKRQGKMVYRTAKFLSGFDHNESRESYFFCELPKCDATTVDEAYEVLKPEAVRIAESMGRRVDRQGDIFAINAPTMTRKMLTAAGASYVKRGNLVGTNHEATETATLPDGSLYARGSLYHNPDFRGPDHARCTLGDGWSLIVKNTVPTTA
jgi:hypothetical protein